MTRPKMPDDQVRSVKLAGPRVTTAGARAFREKCAKLRISEAEGIRQALTKWIGATK